MSGYGDLDTGFGIALTFIRFVIPLFIAQILPLFYLKHRKNFILLFIASSLVYFGASLAFLYYKIDIEYQWFRMIFIMIFLVSIILLALPGDLTLKRTIFFAVSGYTIQNLADNTASYIYLLSGQPKEKWVSWIIFISTYLLIYLIYLFFFLRKIKKKSLTTMDSKTIIIISTVTLGVVCFLSMFGQSTTEIAGRMCANCYAIVSCSLLLLIHFNVIHIYKLKDDNVLLEQILAKENENLRSSKANVELINMKCHDLKHQIRSLREFAKTDKELENLSELEKEISIYDTTIKSGNATLDTLLMEKFLYCKKHNIIFSSIIDGAKLGFIDNTDIYSLFGNAIDNAIKSVLKADKDHRTITLNVKTNKNKLVVIHMENYTSEEVEFIDGLPQTSGDARFHGFGTKSIRYIVEKYDGKVAFKKEGDTFILNIVIPIPEEKEKTNE